MDYFILTFYIGLVWLVSPTSALVNITGNVTQEIEDGLLTYPSSKTADYLEYFVNEDLSFECRLRKRIVRFLDSAPTTLFSHNGTDISFDHQNNGPFKLVRKRNKIQMNVNFTNFNYSGIYGCRLEGSYDNGRRFVISNYWRVVVKKVLDEQSGKGPVRFKQIIPEGDRVKELPVTGFRGENKEILCSVYGQQPINITWFYEGSRIRPYHTVLDNTDQDFTMKTVTNEKLALNAITNDINGKTFRCEATQNFNGSVTTISRSFKFSVEVRPILYIKYKSLQLTAAVGSDFTYNCEIVQPEKHSEPLIFHWFSLDPDRLDNENMTEYIVSSNATLSLTNVQEKDARSYWCFVQKGLDSFNQKFEFNISKPTTLRNLNPDSNLNVIAIVVATSTFLFLMLIVAVAILCMRRRQKKSRKPKKKIIILEANEAYALQDIKDSSRPLIPTITIEGRNRLSSEITSYSDYEFPPDEKWDIPRNRVNFMHNIGEGEFGCVHYGEIQPLPGEDQEEVQPVAIKMLKSNATVNELIDLLQELERMKRFEKHENIINLVGCVTRDGPVWVVVEFAKHGNLRDFLRSHRPMNAYHTVVSHVTVDDDIDIKLRDLISFAHQVACGMEFLAQNKCIHRDLAARNVLVAEDLVIKIADFGLTREVQQDYYKKLSDGKLPIKWMAPEALIDRKYTSKSDVWSFGVLLWEIFTLGGNPYPTTPHERLYEVLKEGHRMDCPPYASEHMYAAMRQCWMYHPAQRPTFSEIAQDFDVILSKTGLEEELSAELSPLNSPTTSSTSCSGSEDQDPMLPPLPEDLV